MGACDHHVQCEHKVPSGAAMQLALCVEHPFVPFNSLDVQFGFACSVPSMPSSACTFSCPTVSTVGVSSSGGSAPTFYPFQSNITNDLTQDRINFSTTGLELTARVKSHVVDDTSCNVQMISKMPGFKGMPICNSAATGGVDICRANSYSNKEDSALSLYATTTQTHPLPNNDIQESKSLTVSWNQTDLSDPKKLKWNATSKIAVNSPPTDEDQSVIHDRKQRRMLSNRESARRSRLRKQQHLDELRTHVAHLRAENSQMMRTFNMTSQHYTQLTEENRILRSQALELTQKLQQLREAGTGRGLGWRAGEGK
eukprot:c12513_g1_i1 orf=216-1151(+)